MSEVSVCFGAVFLFWIAALVAKPIEIGQCTFGFSVDPQEMMPFSLLVCDFEAVPTHACFLFWIDEWVAKNKGTRQLDFCSG